MRFYGCVMNGQTLGMFTLASLVLAMTPGPDMMLFASRSMTQGRKAGFAALSGAMLGCFCQAVAAGLGLSKLFLLVPLAFDAVRLAGAGYLFYLAWATMRGKPETADGATAPLSLPVIARQGLLTNLLNPKVALFMLALLPQFMHPEQGGLVGQVLVLSAIQLATGVLVNAAVILIAAYVAARAATRAAAWFPGREGGRASWRRRLPNLLLGGVFAGLAARLAWAGTK